MVYSYRVQKYKKIQQAGCFMGFFYYFCTMKLSILIPTYNYDCSLLVKELYQQAASCGIAHEIIVADDASTDNRIAAALRNLNLLPGCRLKVMPHNMGRARIRNWLAREARGENLLFIDSDAVVCRKDFLAHYLSALRPGTVVCGGIVHPDTLPSPEVSLRYKYEKHCEPIFTAERRNRTPYAQLRSFNILLPREVALRFPFDENITQYGYEDTLMGRKLAEACIPVVHIDNPLMNGDLETNPCFLKKTEEALHTLCTLQAQMRGYSSLLNLYNKLRRMGLARPMRRSYRIAGPWLRRHLSGPNPSVMLFQLYKLLYLSAINL